jgi:hypothetical protein
MSFRIKGLPADHFNHLFAMTDEELAKHHVARRIADDRQPGYPCRVSLTDSKPGDSCCSSITSTYRSTRRIACALPSSSRAMRPTTR